MPRSVGEILKSGVDRKLFVEKTLAAAPRRRPSRVDAPKTGTLYAIRNKRIAIREAALRGVQIVMHYTKETTGETKKYIVAPYSWRYRRLKSGLRKMLFAWDMEEDKIKSFVLSNIRNVALTDRKYVPRFLVEIG